MDDFLSSMSCLLKDKFSLYQECLEKEPFRAFRVNTLKTSAQEIFKILPFEMKKTPFCDDGYYIPSGVQSLGNSALHHAGAFYIQEPSAMSAVTMLGVSRGDKVLDLCASPGGKSTQIASALDGTGLLWSNEAIKSRANTLLSNIERMGVRNAVVSSVYPDVLCNALYGYFDKVLVDAPCSGEGMFRKDKKAYEMWSREHVLSCAQRQRNILDSAKNALRDGGIMVYSTCTFSKEENEGVISAFLADNPDFELVDSGCEFGNNTLNYAKRIFPFDGGEGHFAAKLIKHGENTRIQEKSIKQKNNSRRNTADYDKKEIMNTAVKFLDENFASGVYRDNLYISGNKIYCVPKGFTEIADRLNFSVLRSGVMLGEYKNGRIEPHHSAFASVKPNDVVRSVNLDIDDQRVMRYLHGEQIELDESLNGYSAVFVNSVALTLGKANGRILKNKYPKGLRI